MKAQQIQWDTDFFPPGTGSSNPSPSSAESATNLVAAGSVARGWDSEFESALLQRGVTKEPVSMRDRWLIDTVRLAWLLRLASLIFMI
jgi:hypothetical protein